MLPLGKCQLPCRNGNQSQRKAIKEQEQNESLLFAHCGLLGEDFFPILTLIMKHPIFVINNESNALV